MKRRAYFAVALLLPFLVSCAGGGGSTSMPSSLPAQSAGSGDSTAPSSTTNTISQSDALRTAQSADLLHANLSVTPSSLSLILPTPQTLTVTVTKKTIVFAASGDPKIATVSPLYVEVKTLTNGSGTAVFTVTPKAVGNARIGLIDLQGMYAVVPVSVSTATATPTPTPTATASATPTPTPVPPTPTPTPVPPTPTPTPTAPPTGNGVFTFNPPSPLSLNSDAFSTVSVSEGNYTGQFRVSACVDNSAGGSCSSFNNGYACVVNDSNANLTIVNFIPSPSSATTSTSFEATNFNQPGYPNETCTFTLSDAYGHSANYVVNAVNT